MKKNFDYQGARDAGYSDSEILSHLSSQNPKFDVKAAEESGYTPLEISQYLSSPQKQGGVKGELQRKVAGPLVEFAVKAGTAIPQAGKSVSTLANRGANYLLEKMGKGLSPDQFDKTNNIINQLGPFGHIADEDQISKIIRDATGGKLDPTTSSERVLKKAAGIAGGVAGFGPGAVLGSIPSAAGTGAMALTTAALEESGLNPWLSLGGGILADIATRSGSSLAKRASSLSKGIPKLAGEATSKLARMKPSDIKNQLVEAGERLGISQGEIPLSAQLKNPAIRSIETKLRESSLSGRHLEKQLENLEEKTRGAFEDISNKISARQNLLPGAISEEAIEKLKSIEKNASEVYSNLYSQANKALPKSAVASESIGKTIFTALDSQIDKLSRGSGTPAKDAIHKRLSRLKEDWKSRFPDGKIPIQELIDLKQDLNQVIKYEVRGGVDKLLNPIAHVTRNAIQNYGKGNTPFAFKFNEAERHFADAANKFRKNKSVQSLLNTQNPQQIINKIKNVKNYRELKNLFGRTKEGEEAFSDLSKYLLEDIIGSKLINKEGKISWGRASGIFRDPKNREIIREIVGPENFEKLKDISKVSMGIEEGLRKFANSSGTATKGLDIALILGTLGKGMAQVMSGNVIKGGKTMSYILFPRVLAKLMSNPEFIQAMVDTAAASKGSSSTVFFDAAKRAARLAIPTIIEANDDESKQ